MVSDNKLIRSNIWRVLKRGNPVTPEDVVREVGRIDKKEVCRILDSFVKKGYVKKINNTYEIAQNLDPPFVDKGLEGFWDYGKVHTLVEIPRSYKNENIYFLARRGQGNRGTCVGQATVYGRELDTIRILGTKPTKEELNSIKRNQSSNVGNCNITRDVLPLNCFSAECAYQWSREVGDVTYPSGSALTYSVKSLSSRGIVFEDAWWTSSKSSCVLKTPYPGTSAGAGDHVINGYAELRTFEDVCQAIYTNGYAYGGILMYENYTSDGRGIFPDPEGEVIGAHALCWIGYDLDKKMLYCIHSWLDWDFVGGISKDYFDSSATQFFSVLDDKEVARARQIYCSVTLRSNYPATWYVEGGIYSGKSVRVSLTKGEKHFITAIADNPDNFNNPIQEICIQPNGGETYTINFSRKSLFQRIKDRIRTR